MDEHARPGQLFLLLCSPAMLVTWRVFEIPWIPVTCTRVETWTSYKGCSPLLLEPWAIPNPELRAYGARVYPVFAVRGSAKCVTFQVSNHDPSIPKGTDRASLPLSLVNALVSTEIGCLTGLCALLVAPAHHHEAL